MQQHHSPGDIIQQHESQILIDWIKAQLGSDRALSARPHAQRETEVRELSGNFLQLFFRAVQSGQLQNIQVPEWSDLRNLLSRISRERARQGYSPSQTVSCIFLLKKPLFPCFQKGREEVVDSARTQTVMETLLASIVETGSKIAIIDNPGVPTVDTEVAQHLMKTVAAARLMGADCNGSA